MSLDDLEDLASQVEDLTSTVSDLSTKVNELEEKTSFMSFVWQLLMAIGFLSILVHLWRWISG